MTSLTWHIVKKDIRRFWPLVALWWLVLALQADGPATEFDKSLRFGAFSYYSFADGPTIFDELKYSLAMALPFLDFLLPLFIASNLIKADSPNNDRSYWRTMPVSGARMLGAKVLFLALFCVLIPTTFSLGVRAYYEIPSVEWWGGLGTYAVHLSIFVMVAAAVSALFRYPLLSALAYLLGFVLYGWLVLWLLTKLQVQHWRNMSFAELDFRNQVALWFLLGTAVTIFVSMYFFRSRKQGLILLMSGFVLAQIAHLFWPYDVAAHLMANASENIAAPGFKIVEDPNAIEDKLTGVTGVYGVFGVFGDLQGPLPFPADEVWRFNHVDSTFTMPTGAKFQTPISGQSGTGIWLFQNSTPVLKSLGLPALLPEDSDSLPRSIVLVSLTQNGIEQLKAKPSHWEGDLYFDTGTLEKLGDLPFMVGVAQKNGELFGLDNIRIESSNVLVDVFQQKLQSTNSSIYSEDFYEPYPATEDYYVLWNPKQGEVIGSFASANRQSPTRCGNGLTMVYTSQQLNFGFIYTANGERYVRNEAEIKDWLNAARLIHLRFIPQHHYIISTKIDPFYAPSALPSTQPGTATSTSK